MTRLTALTWLASLCVPWLLSGCGEYLHTRPQPAAVVEVPVPAYRALDHALTDPIPAPSPPPQDCLWRGLPAVCALDGLLSIVQWQAIREAANVDRATAAKVSAGPRP